uniref:uncharacterized protein LOC120338036 n=1 Tax=Styela clava TaxID=7725 RepID=UPI00193AA90D|nr:uncharacterized protein LOC120338036 [Styela clava]
MNRCTRILLLLSALWQFSDATKTHLCQQMSELFASECEDMSKPGEPAVMKALHDSSVIADFEIINEDLAERITFLENKLINMEERFGKLLNKNVNESETITRDTCPVRYEEKCYRAILHEKQDVDYEEGKNLCHKIGWKLANVYSIEHFEKLKKYLLTLVEPTNYVTVWVAMRWDHRRRYVILSNGAIAEDLPTLTGYPITNNATMNLYIDNSTDAGSIGLMNYDQYFMRRGALCEV